MIPVLSTASADWVRAVMDTGDLQVKITGGFEPGKVGQRGEITIGNKTIEVLQQ